MPMIDIPAKLSEMPDEIVGRYAKTQLGLASGIEYDPPLLTDSDIAFLRAAKVLPTGGALFGILAEGEKFTPADLVAMWNMLGDPFPKVLKVTADRASKARSRIKEIPRREDWKTIFSRLKESGWHRGENDRGWVASFDWLVKNSTVPFRILERVTCRQGGSGPVGNGDDGNQPDLGRM